MKYNIQNKTQLLDMLIKCQNGDMTCLRAIEYIEPQVDSLCEVASWAQAVLTALNVGDIKSGSPLHLKLREIMIAHRKTLAGEEAPRT